MGNVPDVGPGAVRLPPTQPPKHKRVQPKWLKPVAVVVALAMIAIGISSVLNNEVSKRLATVPPATTTTSTTTITVATTTPVTVSEVQGARVQRPAPTTSLTTSTTVAPEPAEAIEAQTPSELIAALERLRVEDEHNENYRRGSFGFYKDADRDGCNTLEEVAISEALEITVNPRTCDIEAGKWFSPFDGKTLTSPEDIDVVNLVPLREAWESGAWQWNDPQRNVYLNDLEHPEALLEISEVSNAARVDKDPGAWVPSNDDYLCDYLKTWVYVKTIYNLSVDPGERESIAAAALNC